MSGPPDWPDIELTVTRGGTIDMDGIDVDLEAAGLAVITAGTNYDGRHVRAVMTAPAGDDLIALEAIAEPNLRTALARIIG